MDDFRKRLTDAMFKAGLTQTALADQLGVSKGAINQWLSGATKPHPSNMVQIGRLLGVDPHWLRTGEKLEQLRETGKTTDPDLMILWSRLLPEQQADILKLMSEMVQKNQTLLAQLVARYGNPVPDSRVEQFYPKPNQSSTDK